MLGLRGLTDGVPDGCCPDEDPCGEDLDSGNCMLCDCQVLEEEDQLLFDSLRSGFDSLANDTGINGLVRESGKEVEPVKYKVGTKSSSSGLELIQGLVFENVGRNTNTYNDTDGLGVRINLGSGDIVFDKKEEEVEELSYLVGISTMV